MNAELPHTIAAEAVHSVLEQLGIPIKNVQEVRIEPRCIVVQRFRTDDEGHKFPAGESIATETIQIGLT